MNLLHTIKRIFLYKKQTTNLVSHFVFPYSSELEIKREQLWQNLQYGILFEDNQQSIPWMTAFADLGKFSEQRTDKGDRTIWNLGVHTILDGYKCSIDVMKWNFGKAIDELSKIEICLGFDDDGNKEFIALKSRLTTLFGSPNDLKLEKFGDLNLGIVEWRNKDVSIFLSGIDQHAYKYRLYIGLSDNWK